MFKKSYNRAVLRLRVETVTPLLIRAGDSGLDPTAVDLSCVRTVHAQHGRTVYIPGSSLKGVIRSAAEASVRGRKLGGWVAACDDPLSGRGCDQNKKPEQDSRGDRGREGNGAKRDDRSTAEVHRQHCLCCRLFGSTEMHGRAGVRDLFPWDPAAGEKAVKDALERANRTEIRYGVSIDRVVGSVKNGPFEQEVVPAGAKLWGEVALLNYQTYQLGLLFAALDELNHGFAQLGSSKSRGLGVVRVAVDSILHEQTDGRNERTDDGTRPLEVAGMATKQERDAYGLLDPSPLPQAQPKAHGLATRFEVKDGVAAWQDAAMTALAAAAKSTGAAR